MADGTLAQKLRSLLESGIRDHIFPGGVAGIVDASGHQTVIAAGAWRYDDRHAPAITPDSIFDVASVTKSIPTATLALQLVHQQRLALTDKLIDWLPEYVGDERDTLTIRDLLAFDIPFADPLSAQKNLSADDLWQFILHSRIDRTMSVPAYANAASILLARVVERAGGKPLGALAATTFFAPLAMRDTGFAPVDLTRTVPTEVDPWRGREVHGEVHDESAFVLNQLFTPGSAGLFTTAPDLLTFLHWLLQPAQTPLRPPGLGWEWNNPSWMPPHQPNQLFGKTGFTGCVVAASLATKTACVLLTNSTFPARSIQKSQSLQPLRQKLISFVL